MDIELVCAKCDGSFGIANIVNLDRRERRRIATSDNDLTG
jgi:hypothetical protein